ncbi:Respiratory burst oxidase homolog protein F [Galdieria sulphuraria]|nr:Respiratory burst oxidase homolog protein F [Galdieria sulphuraria]
MTKAFYKRASVTGNNSYRGSKDSNRFDSFLKLEAFMVNNGMLWTLLLFIACMDIIGFLAGVFNMITATQQHIITIPFLERSLPVAKGAGRVISINAALLLLTGCKATITWLRSTFVSCLLPIDKLMPFLHIRLYLIIAFCAALHAITQYVNYITGSFPWVFGLWTYHFPDPTVQLLITGTLLVILMTAIAVTAGPWIRRSVNRGYNIFWTALQTRGNIFSDLWSYGIGDETTICLQSRIFIKSSGDWSSLVYKVSEELQSDSFAFSDAASQVDARGFTIVNVRGPFGAPTEHVKDFSKVVLVGTGIGATPFSSVVREYLHANSKEDQAAKRVHQTVLNLSQLEKPSSALVKDTKDHNNNSPSLRKVETLLPSFFMNMTQLAYRALRVKMPVHARFWVFSIAYL